ncbi:hypothetical protein D3C72_824300 [compost metagenome]
MLEAYFVKCQRIDVINIHRIHRFFLHFFLHQVLQVLQRSISFTVAQDNITQFL